jgi:hypothetical protein
MKTLYKTDNAELELNHVSNHDDPYPYELGISLYKKTMYLIFSKKELRGLVDFLTKELENQNDSNG